MAASQTAAQAAAMTPLNERRVRTRTPFRMATQRFLRQPAGIISITTLLLTGLLAAAAPVVAPYGPRDQFRGSELQGPSEQFRLGTDHLGRDLLSRIIFGTRVSLLVGVVAVVLGAGIGGGSGMLAGYAGGAVDSLVMRLWDAVFALPAVLIGISLAAAFGAGVTNAAIAIGIATMPTFARIARAAVLAERGKDYVEATRAMGAGHARILGLHIVPNTLGPLLVQIALAMAAAVLLEAGLSFLGLGTQPPQPSWGGMLAESRQYLRDAPWYGVFPGVALTLLVVGLNFGADALRDALDPQAGR